MNQFWLDVVEEFASALDSDDFPKAWRLLAEDCIYRTGSKDYRGREQVIGSFTEASEWAHSNLERIVYEHTLHAQSEEVAAIRFIDIFEHGGQRIVHVCLMHVELTSDAQIRRLTLEELPGERERMGKFLEAFGIKR